MSIEANEFPQQRRDCEKNNIILKYMIILITKFDTYIRVLKIQQQ